MDGAIAPCQLTVPRERASGRVRVVVATRAHDAAIRQLLRDTPMQGEIRLSMEREPSHFDAGMIEGADHRTLVAIEDDRVIAAGSVSSRLRFVNGQPMRVGYLGGLRLHPSCRNRTTVIRRGYELLHQLHQEDGPAVYLTSIMSDNLPARRLLERGLSGMPTYRYLGEFVTLVIRRRRRGDFFKPTALTRRKLRKCGLRLLYGHAELAPAIMRLLNRHNAEYQLAPHYSIDKLSLPELSPESFRVACTSDGEPVACAALWDQRSVKQIVVRGYSTQLHRMRPLINLASACIGRPTLPSVGCPLASAFISHVACDVNRPELLEWLIDVLHGPAHTQGIDYLLLGFDARDPRLALLRNAFPAREFASRLYAVHWGDGAHLAASLDGRLLAPEVALL